MSLLIKGVELPNNCTECPCLDDEYFLCKAVNRQPEDENIIKRRPDFCPIIEIPQHGDLIDADKLVELCDIMADKCDGIGASIWHQFKTTVEWSPIVIPAEEGE